MPKRDKLISVYLNSEEKARVERLARAEGISFAAFIRRAVLRDTAGQDAQPAPADKRTK